MNTKNLIARTVVTFVALTIAGISVAGSARFVTSPVEQTIMVAVGSTIFGSALAFFLIRFFALIEKP